MGTEVSVDGGNSLPQCIHAVHFLFHSCHSGDDCLLLCGNRLQLSQNVCKLTQIAICRLDKHVKNNAIHKHTHTYSLTNTHMHTRTHIHTHLHTRTHIQTQTHTCTRIHTHIQKHTLWILKLCVNPIEAFLPMDHRKYIFLAGRAQRDRQEMISREIFSVANMASGVFFIVASFPDFFS